MRKILRGRSFFAGAAVLLTFGLAVSAVPGAAAGEAGAQEGSFVESGAAAGGVDGLGEAFAVPDGDAAVQACAFGPGYGTFPYEDSYSAYQWALLNTGILKLVPDNSKSLADMIRKGVSDGDGKTVEGGPARENEESIRSVQGIDLNILPAWETYDAKQEKRQVVVALIDTGVDYSHPELTDSIWVNPGEIPEDGVDNDGNGYVDDVYGWNFYDNTNQVFTGSDDNHGTHSAGTIAAARDGVGTVGICDSEYVKVMVIKTLGTAAGVGTAGNVAKAIQYARDNGASICNLSFGTPQYSEALYRAIRDSGMLFVVAAGNGDASGKGFDIDASPVYPASFDLDNIISVANLQLDGTLDAASNYGAQSVDLAAPGSYILSTVSGNQYSYMSGTSMAAPMVTGAAALMYSYDPKLSIMEIKERLLGTARPLGTLTGKTVTGGIPDVAAALAGAE